MSVEERAEQFVASVIQRLETDTGYRAALTRADNPATEYQSWEHLARWCDLEKENERMVFAAVAAALAKARVKKDGELGLGEALSRAFVPQGGSSSDNDAAKTRLRRLLACDSVAEVVSVLRPLLGLIASRGVRLDYSRLLKDLLFFGDRVKLRWAKGFYRKDGGENDDGG